MTGFINMVRIELELNTKVLSYDTLSRPWYDDLKKEGFDIIVENVFNDDYTNKVSSKIIDFIQEEGKTIVLCDGGNKIKEFNLLAKYIKSGDIIMAHDYASTDKYFF